MSNDCLIDMFSSDIFYVAKHMFSKCMLAKRMHIKIVIKTFFKIVTMPVSNSYSQVSRNNFRGIFSSEENIKIPSPKKNEANIYIL